MKKHLIILLLIFSITLCACVDPGEKKGKDLTYNKTTDIDLTIPFDVKPNYITIRSGDSYLDYIYSTTEYYDETSKKIIISETYMKNLYNGDYTIVVDTVGSSTTYNLNISGLTPNFNLVSKKDIFTIEDNDYYYILFSKDGCSSCETVKPKLLEFNDFINTYYSGIFGKLYAIDYEASDYEASVGPDDKTDLIGIKDYTSLINDVSIPTPTLVVIQKGKIVEQYLGITSITNYIDAKTTEIKAIETLNHKIDNASEHLIDCSFEPKYYDIIGETTFITGTSIPSFTYQNIDSNKLTYTDGKITIGTYYLHRFLPGRYLIKFYTDDNNSKTLLLNITSAIVYLDAKDMFSLPFEKYFVYIGRDNCPHCNKIKSTIFDYNSFYTTSNTSIAYPIFGVHRSANGKISGSPEYIVGSTSLDTFKINGYPKCVLIENGVISEYYTGPTEIKENLSKIMK